MAQASISNMQASYALTQYFPLQGVMPSQGGGSSAGFYLGEIGTFAGLFAPAGTKASTSSRLEVLLRPRKKSL